MFRKEYGSRKGLLARGFLIMKNKFISILGKITRKVNIVGINRLIKFFCDADKIKQSINEIIKYDKDLKIHTDLSHWIEYVLFFRGYYELETVNFIKAKLPTGGVFVDVGANIGVHSLIASKIASRVIAIEPNPKTSKRLERNISLNKIKNIKVLKLAVSNKEGLSKFYLPRETESTYLDKGSLMNKSILTGNSISVRVDTLDNILKDELRIDFIKIDAQGNEMEVIEGAYKIIKKFNPVIIYEMEDGSKSIYNKSK